MTEEILMQDSGYNVSARYNVIPTIEVMNEFQNFGFELNTVEAAGVRSVEKALKQKHMVKMSQTEKLFNGEIQPQVIIFNSYDGTAALNIHIGMFRFICSNGMIAGTHEQEPLRILHSNRNWQELVHEYIDTYAEKLEIQKEGILRMKDTRLHLDDAYELAIQAAGRRHADPRIANDLVDPLELLVALRKEDRGDSVWHRFNILQERLVNGIYHKYDNEGGIRKAKILTNIDEISRFNIELSDLMSVS